MNECSDNNGGCEHTCINSEGSYSCSCNSGYSLDSNDRNCSGKYMFKLVYYLHYMIDINECDTNNGGCEQICINKVPLFNCSCQSGFRLANDKFCSGTIIYTYLISTLIPPTQTLMSVVKGFLNVLNYVLIPLEAIDVVVSMDTNLELITTHVLVRS